MHSKQGATAAHDFAQAYKKFLGLPMSAKWKRHIAFSRVFSHGVATAIFMSQNNETIAMLLSQTQYYRSWTLFLCKHFLWFQ